MAKLTSATLSPLYVEEFQRLKDLWEGHFKGKFLLLRCIWAEDFQPAIDVFEQMQQAFKEQESVRLSATEFSQRRDFINSLTSLQFRERFFQPIITRMHAALQMPDKGGRYEIMG